MNTLTSPPAEELPQELQKVSEEIVEIARFVDHNDYEHFVADRIEAEQRVKKILERVVATAHAVGRAEGVEKERARLTKKLRKLVGIVVQGNVLEIDALNKEKGIGNYPKDMTQAMGIELLMEVQRAVYHAFPNTPTASDAHTGREQCFHDWLVHPNKKEAVRTCQRCNRTEIATPAHTGRLE